MEAYVITGLFALIFWGIFYYSFSRDRSRYRNCYLLCFALLSTIPFVFNISGEHVAEVVTVTFAFTLIALMVVPFFLIYNGVIMIKKEGKCAAHLLSLALGIAVLVGEVLTAYNVVIYSMIYGLEAMDVYRRSDIFLITSIIIVTVVYGLILITICSTVLDMYLAGSKQSVQLFILSHKYEEIADAIAKDLHRGVTVLDGQGWYSKQSTHVLMVLTRKTDLNIMLRYIKSIDPDAFLSVSTVTGVYGRAFESIRVKHTSKDLKKA